MNKVIPVIPAILLSGFLYHSNAHALKTNTHVWIADEIINDIQDGSLTIYVDGVGVSIPVNNTLKASILGYKKEFRGGSIGADAFPDPLVGQISIHPGSKDRGGNGKTWNTDSWLKHINSNAVYNNEKAFAYGNLVHSASDVIAHTYVNMYSGDIFDYMQHSEHDNKPERRHLYLESYIGDLTPNLSDGLSFKDSVSIPDTSTFLTSSCYQYIGRSTTIYDTGQCNEKQDYLSRTFLYTPSDIVSKVNSFGSESGVKYTTQMQQYKDAANEGVFGGSHLLAVYELRYKIEQLIKSDSLKDMDTVLANGAVFDWTNSGIANALTTLAQKVRGLEYGALDEIQKVKEELEDTIASTTLRANKVTESFALAADNQMDAVVSFQGKIFALESKIIDLDSKVRQLSCPWWDYVCKKINSEISRNLSDLSDAKIDLNNQIASYLSSRDLLLDSIQKLHTAVQNINLVRRSLDNTVIDLAKVLLKDANPARAILINWAEGIDSAMYSYRSLGLDIMKAEMNGDDPVQVVEDWAFGQCNIQKLIGFGSDFGSSLCKLNKNAEALTDSIHELAPFMGQALALKLNDKIIAIPKEAVRREFQSIVSDKLDEVAPNLENFIRTLESNVTATVLNNEFADGGSEGYLKIPDMAARVDAEMRVSISTNYCNGKTKCFNKTTSPLIFNAIQFSKLSLLNGSELAVLAQKTSNKVNLVSANGYASSGAVNQSILTNGLKSIDGNHQWLGAVAPPLPKDKSQSQNYYWDYDANYGKDNGTLLGRTETDKKNIMYSLFKGPLNEGLFTPKALGFVTQEAILTDTYRNSFDECKGHIFQLGINDHACNGVVDVPKQTQTRQYDYVRGDIGRYR